MTEMEQLKQNADQAKGKQTMKEVQAYLDSISVRIDEAIKQDKRANWVYLASWISWCALDIFVPSLKGTRCLIFIFGLCYSNFTTMRLYRAYSEFRGAIRILEILGIIDALPPPGNKKKRKTLSEFADVVKSWATKKKEAQDKAFAPA